jgi:hypothetical protein
MELESVPQSTHVVNRIWVNVNVKYRHLLKQENVHYKNVGGGDMIIHEM